MCLRSAIVHPDRVLEKGTHLGHEYIITHNGLGYRCGYVKVEAGHPWHGLHYHDIQAEVYGRLTFTEHDVPCNAEGPDSGYWVGFDCAHCDDAPDPELAFTKIAKEYIAIISDTNRPFGYFQTIKTIEYVRNECFSLCVQAAAVKSVYR